ncbi:TPA: hypothetical protein DCX16_01215 [bacterium]|nr:hypothetical protein [bacterium]
MKKGNKKSIEKIIVVSYLLILFIVPLIFLVPVNSVDLTKIGVLWGLLSIILCLWSYNFLKEKRLYLISSPIGFPAIGFFWIAILATIFSQYPRISLVGEYNRLQGLLTISGYIILFYISYILSRSKRVLSFVFDTILLSNFSAGIYGIAQRLGLDPYDWSGGVWTRVHSTFGNPVFYAAWLSMILPLNLALCLREENEKKRFIYILSFLYTYMLLLFANTRATFIGFGGSMFLFSLFILGLKLSFALYGIISIAFVGVFIFVIYFLNPVGYPALFLGGIFIGLLFFGPLIFVNKLFPKKGIFAVFIGSFLLTIIFSLSPSSIAGRFFTTIDIKKEKKQEEKLEVVQDVRDEAAEIFSSSAAVRIMMWRACARIVKDYPILGIGPETLGYVFPRYRDIAYVRTFSEHLGTNRAHNEILDTALNFGIAGLIVYILLFSFLFWIGIKNLSFSKERFVLIGIIGLQAAYLIQNEFSFGATTITSLSWVMIGILGGLTSREKIVTIENKKAKLFFGIPLVLLPTIVVLLLIPYFIGDIEHRKGRVYEESNMSDLAIKYYKNSLFWYPFENSYYYPLTKMLLVRGRDEIDEGCKFLRQALTYTPSSPSLWHSLGTGYYLRGGDGAVERAMACYRKVFEIDPLYAPSHHYIGVILKDIGKIDEAKKSLEYAINLRPENPEFLETLGYLYMDIGNSEEAKKVWEKIIKNFPNYSNIKDVRTRLSLIYYNKGVLDECIEQCKEILKIDPNDINTRKNLATLYYTKKNWQEAVMECRIILQQEPNNTYAKNMLFAMGIR